jgi:DNA phosphorothioation-dependent restriction protein DptH
LHDYLTELAEDSGGSNRRVAQTLAAHVSTLFVFNTLRPGGRKIEWKKVIANDRVTVIQLKGLEHSLSKIVTEFLLWSLIGFVDDRGPSRMSAFVVLDEAHRLSFDAGSPVERLLREGRKFGIGAMLASQQPSDFGPLAFANTATKLIFQVDDDKGYVSRQLARKTSTHSQRQIEELITRLPRGVAYAVLGNVGRLVKIESFDARAERWAD